MKITQNIFIRHAQREKGTDILTTQGKHTSSELYHILENEMPIHHTSSSDKLRARHTAKLTTGTVGTIIPDLAFSPDNYHSIPWFGSFRDFAKAYYDGDQATQILANRIYKAFEKATINTYGNSLAVTHGGRIESVIAKLYHNTELPEYLGEELDNCEGIVFTKHKGILRPNYTIRNNHIEAIPDEVKF